MIKSKGVDFMIKQIAWNTFKNSGNIETFIELMKIDDIQENMEGNQYGNIEDKGNNNS